MPSEVGWDPPGRAPRQLPPVSMVLAIDPRALLAAGIALVGTGGAVLVVFLPLLAVVGAARVLTWWRFRWGFDGRVVRVEQGVFQRRVRELDVGRIQQVEVEQPLLHRIGGLAIVRLETASEGAETEVELDGVLLRDAHALRGAVRGARAVATDDAAAARDATGAPTPPPPPPAVEVIHLSPADLALSAVTGAQLLVFPVILLVILDALSDVGAARVGQDVATSLVQAGVAVVALLVAVLAVVGAVVATLLRDLDFTMTRQGRDVTVRRGLLTSRETVLPRHRVQVVEVRQNWLRRWLGIASLHVRSAGGGAAADQARRVTVPLVRPGADLERVLDALLDGPRPAVLTPHPPRARRRAMMRWTRRLVGLGALVALGALGAGELASATWRPAGLAVAGGLVLVGPVLGLLEYGHLAHALGTELVVTRHGALGVTTGYAPLRRLQGVTEVASPFQRRLGLASVLAHLAGAGATTNLLVLDVDTARAAELREDLTAAAARA